MTTHASPALKSVLNVLDHRILSVQPAMKRFSFQLDPVFRTVHQDNMEMAQPDNALVAILLA